VVESGTSIGSITPFKGSNARDRIVVMFRQVARGIRNPLARTIVAEALQGCPERDDWCEVQALYWAFKNHGRYTGDTRDLDTYQTLMRTWELGIFDCDDATIGLLTLLISSGFRSGAKIIAQDGKTFNHVYAVVELPRNDPEPRNRRIVPLDATVTTAVPGWEAPADQRKLERIYWYQENSV